MIRERLEQVRERIAQAAEGCGRKPDEINLVAVSKVKPASAIREAYEAGQRHFGENYVQELQAKRAELADLSDAVFHFIGKLQSNKTRPACTLFQAIHTVENVKIARRLASQTDHPLDVFLEIKLSPEESKSGMAPDDLPAVRDAVVEAPNLRLRGLMCMPPWSENPEASRPFFSRLRQLAEKHGLRDLSMGMSNDLEAAIEEGSTFVRVGTAIFGKRIYAK